MTEDIPGCCCPLTTVWWLTEGKCNDRKFSCFEDYNRLSTLFSYLLLLPITIVSHDFVVCSSSLLSAAAGCTPARLLSPLCVLSVYPLLVRSTFLLLVGGYSYTKMFALYTWRRYFKMSIGYQRTHLASSFSMFFTPWFIRFFKISSTWQLVSAAILT
jgi:hypothetical protein